MIDHPTKNTRKKTHQIYQSPFGSLAADSVFGASRSAALVARLPSDLEAWCIHWLLDE